MIAAQVESPPERLARQLAARAAALAAAHAESSARKRHGDPARWRKAALLWPLFTEG